MNDSFPLVTVLMPVYNSEKYLFEALMSIVNQSYKNLEILVINDGSQDKSKDVINLFSDSRIVYLENEKNLGLITTLNIGLKKASGKYIVRMDADDISFPDRIENQISFLEKNPEVLLVGGDHTILGEDRLVSYHQNYKTINSVMLFESPVAHPCFAFRKDIIPSINYNECYPSAEDYKFLRDIAKRGRITNLDKVVLQYRKHDAQISSTSFNTQKDTHSKIVAEIISEDMGLFVKHSILHKFFKYEKLQRTEAFVLVVFYLKVLLKSVTNQNYDSVYIFKRITKIIKNQLRSIW